VQAAGWLDKQLPLWLQTLPNITLCVTAAVTSIILSAPKNSLPLRSIPEAGVANK
jgi:hypothetical protein